MSAKREYDRLVNDDARQASAQVQWKKSNGDLIDQKNAVMKDRDDAIGENER